MRPLTDLWSPPYTLGLEDAARTVGMGLRQFRALVVSGEVYAFRSGDSGRGAWRVPKASLRKLLGETERE